MTYREIILYHLKRAVELIEADKWDEAGEHVKFVFLIVHFSAINLERSIL